MTSTQAKAPAQPATDRGGVDEELIGSAETHVPHWAQIDEAVVATRLTRIARAVPVMAAVIARRAWRANRMLTVLAVLAQLGTGFSTAFGLLATANVFTHLLQQGPTPARLVAALPSVCWVVAAQAAGALLTAVVGALQSALAPQVERAAADELYAAILAVDLVAFDDADFTELIRNTTAMGISQIRGATSYTGDLLAGLVAMAAAVTTVAILHPALAPVVLLTAFPQGWANIRAAKATYEHFLRMTSRTRRLAVTGGLITDRQDAAEVRAFTTQPVLLAEHRRIARSLEREALALNIHTARIRILGRGISGVATALAYTVLGLLIYTGSLPLALAGAAALAMRTSSSAVSTTVFTANRLYETSLYYDLYLACLRDTRARSRTTPAITHTRDHPVDEPPPTAPPTVPSTDGPTVIEANAVSFTYPGQATPALTDITITLRAGQVIALVGENGSGKSTLAKLLTGLYLPDAGTINWDGVDIATLAPASLQSHIAVVMQYPTQWPMTAANNIRIGRIHTPDPDGYRLTEAAARAGADAVLADLPDGPDTMLSRRFQSGRDLSGGQWQRISVARALYRDASLIVADEPTAALDAKAEHAVFDTLRRLPTSPQTSTRTNTENRPRQRITVLITHRLANVRNADHIIVLDRGHLTAQGTHNELMAQPGSYRDLFTLQARSYRDEQPCRRCATR